MLDLYLISTLRWGKSKGTVIKTCKKMHSQIYDMICTGKENHQKGRDKCYANALACGRSAGVFESCNVSNYHFKWHIVKS